MHVGHCACIPHQSEVDFSDGAVLEAAVRPASSSFIEGDTKSSACREIQLMTESDMGGKDEGDIRLYEHDICGAVLRTIFWVLELQS